jgi:hypothetical protein
MKVFILELLVFLQIKSKITSVSEVYLTLVCVILFQSQFNTKIIQWK